ncbi:MAG: 3-phosphoshikimate 1-carboxyvinyltransferase [Caldimicrobium sp.]
METKVIKPIRTFNEFSLSLPSSKSLTQRAFICASLAEGPSEIKNPLLSEDPLLLKEALLKTGVSFREKGGTIFEIKGVGSKPKLTKEKVYLGNNGTGARFFLAYSTLGTGDWIELYGKPRLHERPMAPLIEALRKLGAHIECLEREGYFPIKVSASSLHSGQITLPGYVSSQFVSALLLIGCYLPEGLEISIEGELFSKSYVEMTCEVMEKFGVTVENNKSTFYVKPQRFKAINYEVPADASSASYFLAIPLVLHQGKVIIENFDYRSKQADIAFLDFIQKMGATVRPIYPWGIEITFEGRPKAGSFNLKDCPDLFPTMAILGAVSEGKTVLYGAPHLRHKETDRIKAVATEISKLGVKVEELPDGLIIYGQDNFHPAKIETYDDHRIAMAFAILGLKAGPLEIENPSCVSKSFPTFWELLERLYEKDTSHRV